VINKRSGVCLQETRGLRAKLKEDGLITNKLGVSLTKIHAKGYKAILTVRSPNNGLN
jgi:hypothetical protein